MMLRHRQTPNSYITTKLVRLVAIISVVNAFNCFADNTVSTFIDDVIAKGSNVELIKDGFDGTEGPVALPDGSLIFTETKANRITRIAADGTTSTYVDNTNGSNGLGFNKSGDLFSVQTLNPKVGIIYPVNHQKVLADNYEGKPFQRPNDLVADQKGNIYFTDSGNFNAKAENAEPLRTAVYFLKPDGKITRIINDIERPNGIQLSPDEKTLYVANTAGEYVYAYDLLGEGKVAHKREFAKLEGLQKTETGVSSGADGLAIDAKGRLYVASNLGVQVFDAKGKALGIITIPQKPQNLAFAGKDKKTLYIVGRGAAYKIAVLTPGFAGRAK